MLVKAPCLPGLLEVSTCGCLRRGCTQLVPTGSDPGRLQHTPEV